jgi:hypothetical protein
MDEIGLTQLGLPTYLSDLGFEDRLSRMMLTKTKTLVRLYIIEGFDFS